MSDPKDAQGSSAESNPEPLSSGAGGRPEERDRPAGESWFDKLKAAVGLRSPSLRRDLEEALSGEESATAFSAEERTFLHNILGLRDKRVEDIMVPRADVYAVAEDAPLTALVTEFRESGHSRMPVYRETLDDPVGMVHIKDLVSYMARMATSDNGAKPPDESGAIDLSCLDLSRTVVEADLIREVLFVPPSMPVATLLSTMQGARMQMALVIDEFGGTDGLVSIEDAVETIVGDIEDEHDEEEPEIVPAGKGIFIADAGASVETVAEAVGGSFGAAESGDEVETVGGMVFSLLGRIPAEGEVVTLPGGYAVEILDADPRRIRRLRIRTPDAETPAPLPDPEPTRQRPRAAASGA